MKHDYSDREQEILFMDLWQKGEPFEKKYTQFLDDVIQKLVSKYCQWHGYND